MKGLVDEGVEVNAAGEDVAAEDFRGAVVALEGVLRLQEHGLIKEGDLTLEVFLVLEVAVADESLAGDAIHGVRTVDWMVAARFSVVSLEVVTGGYVEGEYFDLHYKGERLWGEGGRWKV